MNFLSRLLGLGLLALLLSMVGMSCETSRRSSNELGTPRKSTAAEAENESVTKQIGRLDKDGKVVFKTPQAECANAFIRQFNDGTVIDRVLVRKAPGDPKEAGVYYLVGMGLHDGMFRAMALPLENNGDSTFSLTPAASRYTITGVGCPTCTFNFEQGIIVGTSCAESTSNSHCDLKVQEYNTLFTLR